MTYVDLHGAFDSIFHNTLIVHTRGIGIEKSAPRGGHREICSDSSVLIDRHREIGAERSAPKDRYREIGTERSAHRDRHQEIVTDKSGIDSINELAELRDISLQSCMLDIEGNC